MTIEPETVAQEVFEFVEGLCDLDIRPFVDPVFDLVRVQQPLQQDAGPAT